MIQLGKIQSIDINPSGYESCLGLLVDTIGIIYCYVPLVNYKVPDIITNQIVVLSKNTDMELTLNIKEEIRFQLKAVYITAYELVNDNCKLGFIQPMQGSSYTIFIGKIKKIIDDYSLICCVDGLSNNLFVELERDIFNLRTDAKIKFDGELSLSII